MRLISIHEWQEKYFSPESAPTDFTARRLLRDAKLPGKKVGGEWFVDEHAWLTGDDPLVQNVLRAG